MDFHTQADIKQRVQARLEFVEIVLGLNAQFLTPGLIPAHADGTLSFDHPWRHFDALMNYLLLTCFDMLGQSREFTDFNSWLVGKDYREEREMAASKIPAGTDSVTSARTLNRVYLDLYGARVSFFRFIDKVLGLDANQELLMSVRIMRGDIERNEWTSITVEPAASKQALFHLRNMYTHRGVSIGGIYGGVVRDWYGYQSEGYARILREERNGIRTDYCVRRWPDVLVDAVKTGLNYIEADSKEK